MIELQPQPEDGEISDCDDCGQTFFTQDVLLMHLKKRHDRDDLAPRLPKAP